MTYYAIAIVTLGGAPSARGRQLTDAGYGSGEPCVTNIICLRRPLISYFREIIGLDMLASIDITKQTLLSGGIILAIGTVAALFAQKAKIPTSRCFHSSAW